MSKFFHSLIVDEILDETKDAYTLYLLPQDPELFHYKAGQYLSFKLLIDGQEYRRAYSLSSSPAVDDRLQVSIKRVPGGIVSNYLRDQLKKGDEILSMQPMGSFCWEGAAGRSLHYVLIGAGSGITPLMSILKSILYEEKLSEVSLWYGNRQEEDIIFKKALDDLQAHFPGRFHLFHSLSQPSPDWKGGKGRLTQQFIYDRISDLFMHDEHRKRYFLCGPTGLMDAAQAAFEQHAVNPPDVFREYYTAPVPTEEAVEEAYASPAFSSNGIQRPEWEDQPVKISIGQEEKALTVRKTESILDAAIEADLDPPYACLAGICTSCRAHLIKGEVYMEETAGLSAAELEEGKVILTCQAHPLGPDVEIEY